MPLLGNPFVGNCPRQMTMEETVQALRVDLAAEYEAIIGYEAHIMATDDERVKKVLRHIVDEERNHVGELEQLISVLCPEEGAKVEEGRQAIVQQQQQNFQAPLQ